MNEFNLTADQLIHRLRNFADGKTVISLSDEISRTTMDMIANVSIFIKLYILQQFLYCLKNFSKSFVYNFFLLFMLI